MESGSAYMESISTVTASSSYPLVYIVPLWAQGGYFFVLSLCQFAELIPLKDLKLEGPTCNNDGNKTKEY